MKMKKIIATVASMAMIASLAACGNGNTTTSDNNNAAQTGSTAQAENAAQESTADNSQETDAAETTDMTIILRGGSYADVIKAALPEFEESHNCKIEVLEMSFDDLHTGIAPMTYAW